MNLVMTSTWSSAASATAPTRSSLGTPSFGITVTLVWLYIEILRLLGYMRN